MLNNMILSKLLKERLNIQSTDTSSMMEGIIIDDEKLTVSLTDDTTKGVDFVYKPLTYKFRNFDVISIFRRTALQNSLNKEVDGNPFIYALKGMNGWVFNITDAEIHKYLKQFIQNCKQLPGSYDTIIMVPSNHDLNNRFMKALLKYISCKNIITDYFMKATWEEAFNSINRTKLKEKCKGSENKYERLLGRILDGFKKMGTEFSTKHINPRELIKFIDCIITYDTKMISEISPLIDDKNVLILDDTLTSGETVSRCVQNITETFSPKSLTVITLLSKKFKKWQSY